MKEAGELSQLQKQKDGEVKKILSNHSPSNTYLDLVNRSIYVIPDELFMLPNIEYLYLESNHLEELPDDFFENLPMLKWLDLRDNKLEYLPPSIGSHRNLKNLLLEKNQLTHLPLELGNVTTITGLSLRGNPLVMPPPEIVEQGVQFILSYLLEELNSGMMMEMEDENGWQYDDEYSEEDDDDEEFSLKFAQSGGRNAENDMDMFGLTPIPAMFHQPVSRNKRHTTTPLRDKRNGPESDGVKVSQLNLVDSNRNTKMDDTSRKNWMAKMQQKRQDTMVLDEWRKEAKRLQTLLVSKSRNEKKRPLPPYGVDKPPSEGRPLTEEERKIHIDAVEEKVNRVEPKTTKPKTVEKDDNKEQDFENNIRELSKMTHNVLGISETVKGKVEQDNAEKMKGLERTQEGQEALNRQRIDNEVQARMRQHTSQLRFRNQRNIKDSSNVLQPGRELQRELLDQKMSGNPELEYRFRAFTGDSSSFSGSKRTSSL